MNVLSETIRVLLNRVSIRQYTEEPVTEETILSILNAARRTATSSNTQSYSFIVIRDPVTKARLAELAGNQEYVAECPVFIVVCADITRLATAAMMHNTELARSMELTMVAVVDAAIAGQSATLAAESSGLGAVMIGGIRNQPEQVAELLRLPYGVFPVYGLCLGYPAESPPRKPRLPAEAVIHYERYLPTSPEILSHYDAELAEHYRDGARTTPDAAWTGIIARKFSRVQRPFLRKVLGKYGFHLD